MSKPWGEHKTDAVILAVVFPVLAGGAALVGWYGMAAAMALVGVTALVMEVKHYWLDERWRL